MTSNPKAVLDISALFEDIWTGIPNMVAAIASRALDDKAIDWTFTSDILPLPRSLVERFLAQRSGAGGLEALAQIAFDTPAISPAEAADMAVLFPNIKPVRRYFGREAIIVSDLSPVISPQFHNRDNIDHFANRIRLDIDSSDHLFCISDATRTDVQTYFSKPLNQMSVIRLGAEIDPADITSGMLSLEGDHAERYVVIVGTLEPRKNGSIFFEFLMNNPAFASRYRVVFVGRDGWLDEKQRLMNQLKTTGVSEDRVMFTGFISESEKIALMLNSEFCVYPSFFEGFGLPVLEATALGKLTVCSNSSSIPEVAPDDCIFFNPSDPFEFAQAIRIAEIRSVQSRSSTQSLADILTRAAPHSWDSCYRDIADWIVG